MRVRFSTCIGLSVAEEGTDEELGVIAGILVHPDTGKVEGFFVRERRLLQGGALFLASPDISHWGLVVRVRDADALSPLEDRIRLASIVEDGRTVLGQRMVTEAGAALGTCADVQFETKTFMTEWFFPRAWWRWRPAVPFSAIVEVRNDAIIVRDPAVPAPVSKRMAVLKTLDKLAEPATPGIPPLDA